MKSKFILAANWKMHKTIGEAKTFIDALIPQIKEISCHLFIAPPFTALSAAAVLAQGTEIVIGAQNMHDAEKGAFTGEISAAMIKESGAQFVILGHSERRQLFHERNAFIHRKIKRAMETGLRPLLCIGETLEEREKAATEEVLSKQLEECLEGLCPEDLILAYEPVWAIGTGKMATPAMAQETQQFCRRWLEKNLGKIVAEKVPILYGGSVKPETIAELAAMPDIDGALVGGASLEVESFVQMAKQLI